MTLRKDHRRASLRHSDRDGITSNEGSASAELVLSVILQTLRYCHGNRTRIAEMLGIPLRTIRNKLRSYWRTSEQEGGQT
ncbi:Bacterial regulatory protein, Fis family [compost metagenome]